MDYIYVTYVHSNNWYALLYTKCGTSHRAGIKTFQLYIRTKYVNTDTIMMAVVIVYDLIHMFSKFVNCKFS
jgi:hypothetical protein